MFAHKVDDLYEQMRGRPPQFRNLADVGREPAPQLYDSMKFDDLWADAGMIDVVKYLTHCYVLCYICVLCLWWLLLLWACVCHVIRVTLIFDV